MKSTNVSIKYADDLVLMAKSEFSLNVLTVYLKAIDLEGSGSERSKE